MKDNAVNIASSKKNSFHSRKVQRGIFIGLMLSVALIQFAIFWVYVNFDSILMAFRLNTKDGIIWTFKNFERFFREYKIPEKELALALKNTLSLFTVSTLIGLPTALLFSYYLYKKVLFAKFFRVVFFLPSIISSVVLVTLFRYLLKESGPVTRALSATFRAGR